MSEEDDYKKFIEMTKLVLKDPIQKENEERLLLALDVTEEEFLKYSYELEKLVKTYGSNKKELTKINILNDICKLDAPVRVKIYHSINFIEMVNNMLRNEEIKNMLNDILNSFKENIEEGER